MAIVATITRLYNKTHWFTDKEAWALFRLFAFGEAIGWTLLISAVAYRHYGWPQSASVIILAGRIHGIFFILYFVASLLCARSMGWGSAKVIAALIAGVGPYTSLVYEIFLARRRRLRPVYVAPPLSVD